MSGGDHALAGHAVPLHALGAVPVERRVVFGERVVTAAGVSAGIDMAPALVERMHGREASETVPLAIEYDPQPPRDAGHSTKASPALVERVRERLSKATGLYT